WIASSTPRSHCASGDVTACTITASSRPDDHIRQRSQSGSTSLGSHNPVSHGAFWCLGCSSPDQPKSEIPIAHRVRPAVRASGTSVRLRRPEPFTIADRQLIRAGLAAADGLLPFRVSDAVRRRKVDGARTRGPQTVAYGDLSLGRSWVR